MRVANPNQVTNWRFFLIDPNGEEVIIPPEGGHSTKDKLVRQVMSYIGMYDNITSREYSKEQRALALEAGKSFEEYISKLVEHQVCIRNKSVKCFNDGVGDKIHEAMGKVDGYIEKAPLPVRKIIERMVASVTPSRSKTLGGCGGCGGTRVMSPNRNNLGRAGRLNRLFNR